MQGGRGGRDPFFDFGDPFASFGSFGGNRSLLPSLFGGRGPFDDPFFTRPFGGMFESSFFGSSGSPFMNMHPTGFLEHQAPQPERPRGPIIEELISDNENEDTDKEKKENPRKHGRSSSKAFVEDPEDEVEEKKSKLVQYRNDYSRSNGTQLQPQARSFAFHSSTVTYGGANGAYYTSSTTRRTGSDGLTFEESKEADTATRQAKHRVSRGLHNKGHSMTRKLNPDGKVDTMQTLHNLNEDELAGFEQSWKGNAQKHMPGWSENFIGYDNIGGGSSGQNGQAGRGGWALPSTEHAQHSGRVIPDARGGAGSSGAQLSGRMKSDVRDSSSYSRGRGRN